MGQKMKKIFLLIFTLIISFAQVWAQSARQNDVKNNRPNIIYVLADDLGYGDIGPFGQKKIETPNIDKLAKEGMIFTQHYAEPVCAPSRYGIMTGRNPGHSYIRGNDEWAERGNVWSYKAMEANPALEGQLPIPDSTITIAKILKKAGYKTALIGKWGLGGPFTTGIPNNQGFDFFYGFLCQREDHNYYAGHLWVNTMRVPLNNKVVNPAIRFPKNLDPSDPKNYAVYSQHDYSPDFMIKEALKFIRENKNHPFFLYYPSPLPHASLQVPPDSKWVNYYLKKFGTNEKPYLGGNYVPVRYPHVIRAAMVSILDEQVGEIVKELKELGIYKNTIIIFTGDNGTTYEGGTDGPWYDSGGPFKSAYGWGKGFLYEGGIREPFVISWPDRIKSDTKSGLISAEWDFLPTICQLIGVKAPSDIQGISYLPTLLDHSNEQKKHPYLYWEFPGYGGQQAVRMGKWKGIIFNEQKGDTTMKLFDLGNDIQEQHDVAAKHPDVVKEMRAIMKKEHTIPQVNAFKIKALEIK